MLLYKYGLLVLLFFGMASITCRVNGQVNHLSKIQETSYLALGDSYTIGESVDSSERFPQQLADRLGKKVKMGVPRIIATTGWTTSNLTEAIRGAGLESQKFDLVSLLIGVNDQYQGREFPAYEPNFSHLLETAIQLAGGQVDRVFVISIPDYAYTPFGQKKDPAKISRDLDAYNEVNRRLASQYGVSYFDITPISREGLDRPELVANDGLHPSGKMYGEWVDMMAADILAKLVAN